jgi:diguanylate cyclase (GGDEF)-like protein
VDARTTPPSPVAGPTRVPTQRSGLVVPGLEILEELGRGAHSVVYRASRDGAPYALKILHSGLADTHTTLVAFHREATLLASIDHPGLTRIHEIGVTGGRPYLVMDLVAGRELAEVVAGGPLPPARVVALGVDLIGPLIAVHRKGLVHRDIKAHNVMVDADGTARLIDFGLVARNRTDQGDEPVVGTLAYAPPEQSGMLKRPVDNRSDLYALGVVLFEAVTGTLPFPDRDLGELLRHHAVTPAPDVRTLAPGAGPGLAAVIATLLAKDPDDRYQSGEALAADLRRLRSEPSAALDPEPHRAPDATPIPLCGRSRELAQLMKAWTAAVDGRGSVCLLRGPAGIGKSRLAAEVAATARARGKLVLRGAADDDPRPLTPLRQAIDAYVGTVGQLPDAERDTALGRIRAAAGSMAPLLASLSPALAAVLDAPPLPDRDLQGQFTLAVTGFLTDLARLHRGLFLQLDGAQWFDPGTRQVLRQLAGEAGGAPLLVLVTGRDDEASVETVEDLATALRPTLDVTLRPLDAGDVHDLVAGQLPGADVGPRLSELLSVRAGGNPLVTLEYLRAVVDAGLLRPSWGTWLLDEDALNALELPQDAMGLILARVAELEPLTRRLLESAAALGAKFRVDVLEAVTHVGPEALARSVAEAAERRLVEQCGEGGYAFLHDRIRAALLDGMPAGALARLHQHIAETLDLLPIDDDAEHVYAVAHHFMHGVAGAAGDRVFASCRAAGRRALDDHVPTQAVVFLEHAADLAAGDADAAFWTLYGTALHRAGRPSQALASLRRALAAETGASARAEILSLLAGVHRSVWDAERALGAVHDALSELGAPVPTSRARLGLTTLALFAAGWLVRCTRVAHGTARGELRRRYELLSSLNAQAGYIGLVGLRPELLVLHALRGSFWLARLGSGRDYALGLLPAAAVAGLAGRQKASQRLFDRAKAAVADVGDPMLAAHVDWYQAAVRYLSRRDDGQEWRRATEEHSRWLDSGQFSDAVGTFVLEASVQGRTGDALLWYRRGLQRAATMGDDEVTALITSGVVVKNLSARTAEIAAELRRVRTLLAGHPSRGLKLNLTIDGLQSLYEQGELGQPFEDTAREFFAFNLKPARLNRQHAIFFLYYCLGRLAQARVADGYTERADRLTAARYAAKQLHAVAKTPLLRTFEVVVRAELDVLHGDPEGALRRLATLRPPDPDAPAVAFEAARVRARAFLRLGHEAEAERQALLAQSIAERHGWSHRIQWLSAEFGVDARPSGTGSHAPASSSVSAGGIERQRLQALEQVSIAASRIIDPDALARIALDETIRILAADRAFLFLTAADGEQLTPRLGRDSQGNDVQELTGYSASQVERVRQTREPVVVTGTEEGAALGAESVVIYGLRSILVAPLLLEGRLLGVVYLDSQVARGVFTAEDAGILTALTNHIAISLETARAAQLEVSVQAERRQRDLAEAMRDANTAMAASLDPGEVLRTLLDTSARLVPCDRAWLVLLRGESVVAIESGSGTQTVLDASTEPLGDRLEAAAGPIVADAATVPLQVAPLAPTAASWLVLPLNGEGGPFGAVVLASGVPRAYGPAEVEVAAALAVQGVTAYEKARLFAKVQELAVVDDLTGLPNRRHFFEVANRDVGAAQRHARPVAAMMADIDHFKRINDTYGHPTGDDVIRVVAGRLAAGIRQPDLIGRYGGEEFTLLLSDAAEAAKIAERLRAVVASEPIETRSGPLEVTISVGLAFSVSGDAEVSSILARADAALYEAKKAGRNVVRAT